MDLFDRIAAYALEIALQTRQLTLKIDKKTYGELVHETLEIANQSERYRYDSNLSHINNLELWIFLISAKLWEMTGNLHEIIGGGKEREVQSFYLIFTQKEILQIGGFNNQNQ